MALIIVCFVCFILLALQMWRTHGHADINVIDSLTVLLMLIILYKFQSLLFVLFSHSVLGHEGVAEVIECKRSDVNVKVGDRVTFSIADSCQACQLCKSNLPQKCAKLLKVRELKFNMGT